MPFPIAALVPTTAAGVGHGGFVFTHDGWAIRAYFEETHQDYDGLIYLTGAKTGTFEQFRSHERCLAIAADYRTVIEYTGAPCPPSKAIPRASLAIHDAGHYIVSRLRDAMYLTKLDGLEATGVNGTYLFHFDKWEVSIIDANSARVGDGPLFAVEAARSTADV
ncbi:hypothetical protein [Stenotrophomonas maltophilia]|uniref:hypothetical protein n=1 Tax=Stenotrophomonas maltophilia TaxID=40324 RepID=UPI0038760C3F